jgi:hypothetical protein
VENKLLEAMIAAGWDRVCSAVREAGRKAIAGPGARKRLADALRRTAELLEKEKGNGVLQPDAETGGERREARGH